MKRAMRARAVVAVLAIGVLAASVMGGAAVAGSNNSPAGSGEANIVETAVSAGSFTTLVSLLEQSGLDETLATDGEFTVFAPTDAAFAKVPKKTLAALRADPAKLKAVLLYHVADGKLLANRVMKRTSIKTLNGASVDVKVTKGVVKINNARVQKANVEASNGVIHVINKVLLP
jgi:uncharacterized surface protein with fasciclin (FAS1) repeats